MLIRTASAPVQTASAVDRSASRINRTSHRIVQNAKNLIQSASLPVRTASTVVQTASCIKQTSSRLKQNASMLMQTASGSEGTTARNNRCPKQLIRSRCRVHTRSRGKGRAVFPGDAAPPPRFEKWRQARPPIHTVQIEATRMNECWRGGLTLGRRINAAGGRSRAMEPLMNFANGRNREASFGLSPPPSNGGSRSSRAGSAMTLGTRRPRRVSENTRHSPPAPPTAIPAHVAITSSGLRMPGRDFCTT